MSNFKFLKLVASRKKTSTLSAVVPPAENGAVFVTTNVVITPNQTQGRCPEDLSIKK